jgi:aryl-alcohol dehydrogenase-like predicted oxidoreductase
MSREKVTFAANERLCLRRARGGVTTKQPSRTKAAERIGVIPRSPEARGRLTRDWTITGTRSETDGSVVRLFAKTAEADKKVADRVAEAAAARGVSRAQVALAWLLSKPVITAPIVGATKPRHLDDAIASVNVKPSADEIAALEHPYIPHAVVGFT